MAGTTLILGGYGAAGLAIARLVLRETPLNLALGGRDGGKATAAAAEMDAEYGGDRVTARQVDAHNPASLDGALRDCILVIVCIPLEGVTEIVVRAAIRANVDLLDISAGVQKKEALRGLAGEIERSGRCFITEAGAMPGLPAVLVMLAAEYFDQIESASVSGLINQPDLALGSATDVIWQVAAPAFLYEHGAWQKVKLTTTHSVDFGDPFGRKNCFPTDLAEMRELPERLGLKSLGSYGAGVNWVSDLIVLAFALGGLGRFETLVQLGAELLVWANRRFTKPPFGTQIKLEAEGSIGGAASRLDVIVGEGDGYESTAIPIVALILQLLEGSIQCPGLHHMSSVVDPHRLLEDMRRLGLHVSGF